MQLSRIVALLRSQDLLVSAPTEDLELTSLSVDSRTTTPGALFLAESGSMTDGHLWIPMAVEKGALAVVAERYIPVNALMVIVRDSRAAIRFLADVWYDSPALEMRLVGVTGTNGKTTTTSIIRHLLNADHTAGLLGTLGAFDGQGRRVISTAGSLTTPGTLDLLATLRNLRNAGVAKLAMECSSHALDQGRLDGLRFTAAVFTNLTHEHLDYHGSMERYLAAKLRMADLVSAEDGVLAVNADDPHWKPLLHDRRTVTWGMESGADLRAESLEVTARGSGFQLTGRFGTHAVWIPYLGEFNVANALAAMTVALELGMPAAEVLSRIEDAPQVPGRLELLANSPVTVLRDYAHTPDAFERVLKTLRPLVRGRLFLIFGCGGDRDRSKRPEMGMIAAGLADRVMLTEDNPRTEDPEKILDEIVAGMPAGSYQRCTDRKEAIHQVLNQADGDDLVLLAGKGHETYQIIGTERRPFDEKQIVREALGL